MTLLADRCLKRSYLVQELVESWQLARGNMMIDSDLDEILAECIEFCHLLVRAWSIRQEQFFSTGAGWLEGVTRTLDASTAKGLDLSSSVLEIAAGRVIGVTLADSLRDEIEMLRSAQRNAARINYAEMKAQIEASRADFARGDYRAVEDILADYAVPEGNHAS